MFVCVCVCVCVGVCGKFTSTPPPPTHSSKNNAILNKRKVVIIDTSNTSTTAKYWRDGSKCSETDEEHKNTTCPNAIRINGANIGEVGVVIVGAQCVASIQLANKVGDVVQKVSVIPLFSPLTPF